MHSSSSGLLMSDVHGSKGSDCAGQEPKFLCVQLRSGRAPIRSIFFTQFYRRHCKSGCHFFFSHPLLERFWVAADIDPDTSQTGTSLVFPHASHFDELLIFWLFRARSPLILRSVFSACEPVQPTFSSPFSGSSACICL